MFKYMRMTSLPVIALSITIAACGGDKDQAAEDALARDLELAAGDSLVEPSFQDEAPVAPPAATPAPAPSRPAPAPARPAPKPATSSGNTSSSASRESALGTIAAGSTLNLTSNARVCTNTNKVGDRINASVSQAVSGSNGAVIPAGATVSLEITQLKRSENVNDDIVVGLAVRSVSFNGRTYNTSGNVTYAQVDNVKQEAKGKDAKKVATGAAVGAVLGQVIGKNTKGTVIGTAAGAAAGAVGAAVTANTEGCIPENGRITVTLSNGLEVHT